MKYRFKGIDCINCAINLEEYLNKKNINIKIDFINKTIETNENDIEKIKKVAREKEINFNIYEDKNFNLKFEKNNLNKSNIPTLISAIIFLFAFFIEKYFYLYLKYDINLYYVFNFLYILSFIILGSKVIYEGIILIKNKEYINEKTFMLICFIGSFYLYLFEEAAALVLLYKIGDYFKNLAIIKSKENIKDILISKDDYVKLKDGRKKNVLDVKIGDEILVSKGEKIKFDSEIIFGESEIDNKIITGESRPIYVKKGNKILAGSINLHSLIIIKVLKKFKDSNVYNMIKIIENSSLNKSEMEEYITKLTKIYMPIMLLISFLVMILPPIIFLRQSFLDGIYNGINILIISCPCSLILSIPLAFYSAIGRAAKDSILIRNSRALENLNDMNMLILDKTGTITKGNFSVTKIKGNLSKYKEYILKACNSSEHLISKAIYEYIIKNYDINYENISKINIKQFNEILGKGLDVEFDDNNRLLIGNQKLFKKNIMGITNEKCIYISLNENIILEIFIEDELKQDSYASLEKIRKNGISNILMLSGDEDSISLSISKKMKIEKYFSSLLPLEKLEILKKQKINNKVIYIGDGINDGPSIALADIGIAIGNSVDINREKADIIFNSGSINDLNKLYFLSRKINEIIFQNLSIILFVKVSIMIYGIFNFMPIWLSIFADVGIGLIAILNSIRLFKIKFKGV